MYIYIYRYQYVWMRSFFTFICESIWLYDHYKGLRDMNRSSQFHGGKNVLNFCTSKRERIKVDSVKLSWKLLAAVVAARLGNSVYPTGGWMRRVGRGGKRCEEVKWFISKQNQKKYWTSTLRHPHIVPSMETPHHQFTFILDGNCDRKST